MRNITLLFVLAMLASALAGCGHSRPERVNIDSVPLQRATFTVHPLDSNRILNPTAIYCCGGHVVIFDGGSTPFLTFWTGDSLHHEFSAGSIGQGPNEFLHPRDNYFVASDSGFYLLDSGMEWEVRLKGESLQVVNKVPITTYDAINQLVRLGGGRYIMAGLTDGSSGEHLLFDQNTGSLVPFGEYPPSDAFDTGEFIFNLNFTAGREGKPCVWDFYQNRNLIRQYSTEGELLRELALDGIREWHNPADTRLIMEYHPYWRRVVATDNRIYTLFYHQETIDEIDSGDCTPELQVWDWDGRLQARYLFDRPYSDIAVSEAGVLYAINQIERDAYQVYTFRLPQADAEQPLNETTYEQETS